MARNVSNRPKNDRGYRYEFAVEVVENFCIYYARATRLILQHYGIDTDFLIYIFLEQSQRWEHFKRLAKKTESFCSSHGYIDPTPIQVEHIASQILPSRVKKAYPVPSRPPSEVLEQEKYDKQQQFPFN